MVKSEMPRDQSSSALITVLQPDDPFRSRKERLTDMESRVNELSGRIAGLEEDYYKTAGYLQDELQLRQKEHGILTIMFGSLKGRKPKSLSWEEAETIWEQKQSAKSGGPGVADTGNNPEGINLDLMKKIARSKVKGLKKAEKKIEGSAKGLFRKLARQLHSDTGVGDTEEFTRLVERYKKAQAEGDLADFVIEFSDLSNLPADLSGGEIAQISARMGELEKRFTGELERLQGHPFHKYISAEPKSWNQYLKRERDKILRKLQTQARANLELSEYIARKKGTRLATELLTKWHADAGTAVAVRHAVPTRTSRPSVLREQISKMIRPLSAEETADTFFKDWENWDQSLPHFLAIYEGVRTGWGPVADPQMPAVSPEARKYLGLHNLEIVHAADYWDTETDWFREPEDHESIIQPDFTFPQVDWEGLNDGLLKYFGAGHSFDMIAKVWQPLDPKSLSNDNNYRGYLGAYSAANQNGWKFFIQRWDLLGLEMSHLSPILTENDPEELINVDIIKGLCGGPQLVVYASPPKEIAVEGKPAEVRDAIRELNVLVENLRGRK